MCLFPAPGGEPLQRVSGQPANFALASKPTKKCLSRRLPRITQRDAFNVAKIDNAQA
jgi:hypothetical protein